MNIEKDLFELQDKEYREFQIKLCPGVNNIIGVRLPELRKYAKKISKTVKVADVPTKYYEEIMVKGMLIGLEKDLNFEQIENFIPLINNWAVCDTFCNGLKKIKNNKELMWEFIQKYLKSEKEFEVRFAVDIILQYYIDSNYIDKVLKILSKINHKGYYAQMAVAWAYSICFVKFYDKTKKFFEEELIEKKDKPIKLQTESSESKHTNDLNEVEKTQSISLKIDKFIYNKSIQKAIESYRLTKEQKDELRKLKIK